MLCPLCNSEVYGEFAITAARTYFKCDICNLIFTGEKFHLSQEDEKNRYCLHQNTIADKGYVKFLNQLAVPLYQYLPLAASGLDYGCGPGPVLAELIEKKGFSCDLYDPYFFPKLDFDKRYDFIAATECFEHFFNPKTELEKINMILKPVGILAIMTELFTSDKLFADWYYIKDPTHVCFYSPKTIVFICTNFGYTLLFTDEIRVVILRKN